MNVVTFALTLPVNGSLEEYVDALMAAREAQLAMGHDEAAEALKPLIALAACGLTVRILDDENQRRLS